MPTRQSSRPRPSPCTATCSTARRAAIDNFKLPDKRQPDDAPRWARTDQPIALWDYATADQLQGDGSAPLNVYFRIPPDIFYAGEPQRAPAPRLSLQLHSHRPHLQHAGAHQQRLPRLHAARPRPGSLAQDEADVPVPVVNLRPFSNSLSFDFTFQLLKKGGCQDTTPINMQGAILRDSYLDLRGYPHYAPMPNLEIFANAGFPFTRLADLSETTVVLPPRPPSRRLKPSSR